MNLQTKRSCTKTKTPTDNHAFTPVQRTLRGHVMALIKAKEEYEAIPNAKNENITTLH